MLRYDTYMYKLTIQNLNSNIIHFISNSIPSKYWKMSLYEPKHVSRALSSRSLPSHLSSSGLAKKIPMELNESNSGTDICYNHCVRYLSLLRRKL